MAKVKVGDSEPQPKMRPALTRDAKEKQMIYLAENLAEQQLREGTASSQVITHYLKLATERERLERVRLEKDIELSTAKAEALKSAKRVEELYINALNAMRNYSGQGDPNDY